MSETVSSEFIGRRLDGLQNNVSGLTRRMVTLESSLANGMEAHAARRTSINLQVASAH